MLQLSMCISWLNKGLSHAVIFKRSSGGKFFDTLVRYKNVITQFPSTYIDVSTWRFCLIRSFLYQNLYRIASVNKMITTATTASATATANDNDNDIGVLRGGAKGALAPPPP